MLLFLLLFFYVNLGYGRLFLVARVLANYQTHQFKGSSIYKIHTVK